MNDINGFFGEFRWLSNFAKLETPIVLNGIEFHTTENAYQAGKCKQMDDFVLFGNLSASEAKAFGKQVEKRFDFEENKLAIMESLLEMKFSQPSFKEKLLATGNCYIEETNTWNDTFWGVCDGVGENNLGMIIMKIRNKLK